MRYFFILIILASQTFIFCQDQPYKISGELSLGYSGYLTQFKTTGINKTGPAATLGFFWQPEHLLEGGIETGYYYMFSYDQKNANTEFGTTDVSASMTSLPVILVFRMKIIEHVRLFAGSGIIILFNQGKIFGDEYRSSQLSIMDYLGASYSRAVSRYLNLGITLKYNYIFKIEESTLSVQLNVAYSLLEW